MTEGQPAPNQPPGSTPPPAPAAAPAKPAAIDPNKMDRRGFLSWFGIAWLSFAAATTGALSIVLRYLFPNVVFEPPTSFKAGLPSDYEIGVVDERWKEKFGVWMVRTAEGIYALSTICTHLGCTPNWLGNENKFKCPCHGSGFYKTGINFEGPAPRPLERLRISLAEDGQILIDKSKKFQQEKGEWNNPESFLTI
ncbi:MAG TPA: ubiquinol-cytochrome c reductase iron-sulfur subunit [Candidatus Omnitrophota bacterium]|nr:ubiquinol-cytochrome c reductase iron-sulfur subunit [Candidatus Omnitrophota bacterium]